MSDWHSLINAALRGGVPEPEEPEMWVIERTVEEGELVTLGLPQNAKGMIVRVGVADPEPDKGASVWGSRVYQSNKQGLWGDGHQWELWVPPSYVVADTLRDEVMMIELRNQGPKTATVCVSGT